MLPKSTSSSPRKPSCLTDWKRSRTEGFLGVWIVNACQHARIPGWPAVCRLLKRIEPRPHSKAEDSERQETRQQGVQLTEDLRGDTIIGRVDLGLRGEHD